MKRVMTRRRALESGKVGPSPGSHFLPWFILPFISEGPRPLPAPRTEPETEQSQLGRQLGEACHMPGSRLRGPPLPPGPWERQSTRPGEPRKILTPLLHPSAEETGLEWGTGLFQSVQPV